MLLDPGFNKGLLTAFHCQVSVISFKLEYIYYLYIYLFWIFIILTFSKGPGVSYLIWFFNKLTSLIVCSFKTRFKYFESFESCFFFTWYYVLESFYSSSKTFFLIHCVLMFRVLQSTMRVSSYHILWILSFGDFHIFSVVFIS